MTALTSRFAFVAIVLLAAACGDGEGVDFTGPQPFACGSGGLMCEADEACAATGTGVCPSEPRGPGGCGPNCAPYTCGGREVCMCSWFDCRPLGAACTTCVCAIAQPGNGSCLCDDTGDGIMLSCPGA